MSKQLYFDANEHYKVMEGFLRELNKNNDNFILKGGTSLFFCYNLNRFSVDIDLDGLSYKKNIFDIVEKYCNENGYKFRIAKDTATTKRAIIHYENIPRQPLKIEVSYRNITLGQTRPEPIKINNILVYSIDELANQKFQAYEQRNKIRDLYDVSYIITNYWKNLSEKTQNKAYEILKDKNLNHFDDMLKQEDPLINVDKMEEMFLETLDKLNLLEYETIDLGL